MNTICVYCGSSSEAEGTYVESATELASEMAKRDIELVYGGANSGVMGTLADAVLEAGGSVTGVIPESILEHEEPHPSLTELEVVETKDRRKQRMTELADGFVALPGGIGTQEEIFQALGEAKHGFHGKPCGFLNVAGYYDNLVTFLDHAETEGFLSPAQRTIILVESEPSALLDTFGAYSSPFVEKTE